jgi:hypothetical protein
MEYFGQHDGAVRYRQEFADDFEGFRLFELSLA